MRPWAYLSLVLLSGCTGLQQKAERYRDVAAMAANPEKIEVRYSREGGVASFYECRCTGPLCEETTEN